jgi:phosphoribosylaminoimidazole-succinocarboxamide synthase
MPIHEGSAWSEYKSKGTMHGIGLPKGLKESQKLPQPVFTPSTKAEAGQHDENIHPAEGMAVSRYRYHCINYIYS